MSARLLALCLISLAAAVACPGSVRAQPPAGDLEISIPETAWGFDGKAVRETFVPLSILIQNTGPKMASGTLRLSRLMPLDVVAEPPVELTFDVPPFEERWVQAPVFILDEYVPYELSWGSASKQKIELPQARLGEPAVVLLANPNDRPKPSGALRRFRSNLFPASVTATDGLKAVFLDSVPDFQGARLQTFLEWLQRGGAVVLLHGDDHAFPKFPTALAALNDPADAFLVAAGQVRRVPLQARDVDDSQLRLASSSPEEMRRLTPETTAAFADPYNAYNGRYPWNRDRDVLEKLESVSRFHRRWWLIYPLAVLYLLALFPGSFAIARASQGVRRFYIAYFAIAIFFSWAFKTLGGVGGGDKNRVRSATVAYQMAPGLFDCSQWNCLAAVDGGRYALAHEGSGRLYAPCEEFETPHGLVTTGADAKYEIDIPVASTRTAIARFRANAPPVAAELRSPEFSDQKLASCSVAFTGLPSAPLEAFVCHRETILRLRDSQGVWDTDRRRSMTTSIFISNMDQIRDYSFMAQRRSTSEPLLSNDFYRTLERKLVGNAFQIRGHVEPWSAAMPPGRVRVMALVEADRSLAAKVDGFEDVQGCVLYVLDLPISEN